MRHLSSRIVIVSATVVILAITAAIFFAARVRHQRAWNDAHPLSDPTVGFRMYIPTEIPGGLRITGKRITVHHASFYGPQRGALNRLVDVGVDMNLRKGNWVYSIQESRAGTDYTNDTSTALRNYDLNSKEPTCTQRKSPKGQSYRLCHWTDYGRISVFETKFIKGDTYIDTTFPVALDKPISVDELDKYVDSLKRADPTGLPILADAV